MPRVLHIAVLAALLVGAPRTAAADRNSDGADDPPPVGGGEGEIVGILRFETSGLSKIAARAFEDAVERGLRDNGFQVAPRKRMLQLLGPSSYAPGCLFGPCLVEVERNTEVKLVLVARITAVGPAYTFVMSLLDTGTGRPTSQMVEQCEVCTVEEAIATATLAVVSLIEGAGGAVVDPVLGPTATGKIPDFKEELQARDDEIERRRRRLRQSALFFTGAALLAGGAGAYFLATDERERGLPAVGVGAAFAVASGTLLVLSRRF